MTRMLAALQGVYYILTGVWPLFSMRTFEMVSGPKTDDWLVQTVGILISVIGFVLTLAAATGQLVAPVRVLAIGSAAGLAFVDFFYPLRGVIWPIYMLDGIAETGLIVLWIVATIRDRAAARTGTTETRTT